MGNIIEATCIENAKIEAIGLFSDIIEATCIENAYIEAEEINS